VYWEPSEIDEYGNQTVEQPRGIRVKVEKVLEDLENEKQEVVRASLRIQVGEPIAIGGFIWIGSLGDLDGTTPTPLYQVIEYEEVANLRATKFDRWAILAKHSDSVPTLT